MSCGVEGEMAAGTCASCGSRLYVERADAHLERKARGDDALTRALIPVNVPSIAMVAGYLGLLSILIFPAPGALIAGIVGVVHLRKHPEKSGMGRCITGIVLGLLFSVIGAAMLFDII